MQWMALVLMLGAGLSVVCVPESAAEVEGIELQVDGLSCPFCSLGLEKKLKRVGGVEGVQVHMKQGITEVQSRPEVPLNLEDIRQAVKEAGFTLRKIRLTVKGRVVRENEAWVLQSSGDETRYLLFDAEHAEEEVGQGTVPAALGDEHVRQLQAAAKTNAPVVVAGLVHEHGGLAPGLLIEQLEVQRP